MHRLALLLATLALAPAATQAAPAPQRDEAGVRAAETAWSEAVLTGDVSALEALLDPDYVTVNAKGVARSKQDVIDFAKTYSAAHPGAHAKPLPPTSTVELIGTTALVRHRQPTETSMDLLYFKDGRWRAHYSQHTAIAEPAPHAS